MYEASEKMKNHLEKAREQLELKYPNGSWRNTKGGPTKEKEVMYWRKNNPHGTKADCKRETGLCFNTINKYWDYDFKNFNIEQYLEEKANKEKDNSNKKYRKGHGGRRIIYKKGDIIGNNNIIYIKETEPYIIPSNGNTMRKAIFKCPYCGKEFSSLISNVKCGNVKSCGCLSDRSKNKNTSGELKIKQILENNDIRYEQQKTFKNFISKLNGVHYSYDFYLPDFNILIEYDGEYHYLPIRGQKRLEQQKINDEIKEKYAIEHNFSLIRIPYTDFNKLNDNYLLKLLFNK